MNVQNSKEFRLSEIVSKIIWIVWWALDEQNDISNNVRVDGRVVVIVVAIEAAVNQSSNCSRIVWSAAVLPCFIIWFVNTREVRNWSGKNDLSRPWRCYWCYCACRCRYSVPQPSLNVSWLDCLSSSSLVLVFFSNWQTWWCHHHQHINAYNTLR